MRARIRSVLAAWRAFFACRRGGAVLYVGVGALTLLTSVGGMMTNFAWREAQMEEIQAALRAAVSSVGPLLDRLNNPTTKAATEATIKDRVAKFLDGLLPQIDIDDDDVTVSHEATSRITRISIGGQAQFVFNRLFGTASNERGTANLPTQTVAVQLLTDRYEIAVAADLTASMTARMEDADGGFTGPRRIDALKTAAEVIEDVLADRAGTDPGSMAVAIVPFGSAVNVADTSGSGDTTGKRRYAHMLMGASIDTDTARASTHHWVDTFHYYGTGNAMGELQSRTLPDFILGGEDADGNARSNWTTTADWSLRDRSDVIDIEELVPMLCSERDPTDCDDSDSDSDNDFGKWQVEGEDMWNGCVMARWGAYWHADARPSDWDANNPATSNWPARADVARWTPARSALTSQPLHLSDAPPSSADPNTRFTAYSWPDSRIFRSGDAQLHAVMTELLEDSARATTAATVHTFDSAKIATLETYGGYNDWSARGETGGGDGASLCPGQAITPLTDDSTALAAAFDALDTVPRHAGRLGETYLHLGVVWGLRALSPLWEDAWMTTDANNQGRPLAACASGETGTHCDPNLKKTIVLITDGYNYAVRSRRGRIARKYGRANGDMRAGLNYTTASACHAFNSYTSKYGTAMGDTAEATFNARFSAYVDSSAGTFTAAGLDHVADTIDLLVHDGTASATAKAAWKTTLTGATPWQLFRGHGLRGSTNIVDSLMSLEKTSNKIGLTGRPMHNDHVCRRGAAFSPYGGPDDLVQVGGTPVAGVAPFTRDSSWTDTPAGSQSKQQAILDDWLLDACQIAGDRDVRVRVIFLNDRPGSSTRFNKLEECIDKAGGEADVNEVYSTPTQQELKEAFDDIFRVERNLRFID